MQSVNFMDSTGSPFESIFYYYLNEVFWFRLTRVAEGEHRT